MLLTLLRVALRELNANRLRSLLTMLGIAIGAASLVIVVTIIQGVTLQVDADISSVGSNVLIVAPVAPSWALDHGPSRPFELTDADAIATDIPGITAVAPIASRTTTVAYGNRSRSLDVFGTTAAFLAVRSWPVVEGRNFDAGVTGTGQALCVLGASARADLLENQRALGAIVRIGDTACEVIGVLARKGHSVIGPDQDNIVVMPFAAFARRLAGSSAVEEIWVSASSADSVQPARAAIGRLLRERRGLGKSGAENFRIQDVREVARLVESTSNLLTAGTAAIAGISLVVGGIGIMNIMLVTILERTREIGIRLAAGATEREVLLQFLIESTVLSCIGGILGISIGLTLCAIAAALIGIPLSVSAPVVALSFALSAATGIVFGLAPARRAAKLNPIDALRYE